MYYRTGKYTVCRCVRAFFSPEILQAGAVKGLKVQHITCLSIIFHCPQQYCTKSLLLPVLVVLMVRHITYHINDFHSSSSTSVFLLPVHVVLMVHHITYRIIDFNSSSSTSLTVFLLPVLVVLMVHHINCLSINFHSSISTSLVPLRLLRLRALIYSTIIFVVK